MKPCRGVAARLAVKPCRGIAGLTVKDSLLLSHQGNLGTFFLMAGMQGGRGENEVACPVVRSPDRREERGGPGETRGLAAGLLESPSRVNGGLFPSNSHSSLAMLLTYLDLPLPQAGGRSLQAGSLPRTPRPSLPLLKHSFC